MGNTAEELMQNYVNSQEFTSTTDIMEAIGAAYPKSKRQRCIIHLADLKLGYQAINAVFCRKHEFHIFQKGFRYTSSSETAKS